MEDLKAFRVLCVVLLASHTPAVYVRMSSFDLMKCSYGERGSLTATCVNATTNYFKNTPYRFDHLDETLRCVNCTLETLESGSFDISGNQIRSLDLSESGIATIRPKAFVGLIFLQRLVLSNNDIQSIYPGTFTGVKKIDRVDLQNNSVSILSQDGFLELVGLEELNLRNNRVKSIAPMAFNGLARLHLLDLSRNEIAEFKGVFGNLTELRVLDLSDNKISALTGDDFDGLGRLLELRFGNNHIRSVPASEFYTMGGLRRLDLSFNVVDRLIPGSFRGLDSLEDLDLSHNNLSEIPQRTLQSLHRLQHLNVSFNKLEVFRTGLYSGLPNLRVLNFSHNAIEDIEITGVFSLDSLDTLDFSANNVTDLDYVGLISRLPKIAYLSMEDNLLPCGLEKEMDGYFAQDNFKFKLYANEVGKVKCVDNPSVVIKHDYQKDRLIREGEYEAGSATTAWIFLLISFTLVSVTVLYYLQWRTFQQLKSVDLKRTTSQAQLISSDLESRDNDYLKE